MKKLWITVFVSTSLMLAACGNNSTASTSTTADLESSQEEETVENAEEDTEVEETEESEAEVPVLQIGETAATDMVELTLLECRFADKVGLVADNWLKPNDGAGGRLSAGEGKTYLWFSFNVKNISKEDIKAESLCNAVVDYNNGYVYDDSIFASTSLGYGWSSSSITSNVGLPVIEPLGVENLYGFIKCVDVVKKDRKAPLKLIFTLPDSTGSVQFAYDYSAAEGADASEESFAVASCLKNSLHDLDFVRRYAGNVSGNGQRAFADATIESVRNSFTDIDEDYVKANLPKTAAVLPDLNTKVNTIADLLIDMGEKNSDEHVDEIKTLAGETIEIVEDLLASELSTFN